MSTAPVTTAPAAVNSDASAPPPVGTIDTHCQAVARLRASDARANGYSFKMESIVYDGTYQTCVAWDMHHNLHFGALAMQLQVGLPLSSIASPIAARLRP
jgi:hypothetical protein